MAKASGGSNYFEVTTDDAQVLKWLVGVENKGLRSILVVVFGVVGLSALAQVAIPLPWTPVPITGQTFGVALIGLLWGRKHGLAVFSTYLSLSYLGLPVLASGGSGLAMGPTSGYLIGMFAAVGVVGSLSDSGFAKGFVRNLISAYVGSILIFSFGLIALSFFVSGEALLAAGLYPFLLGDLINNVAAASIASSLQK